MGFGTASYDPATGQLLGIKRSLLAIYQDLDGLSTAQKSAVWTDFTSGSPPRWSLDEGADAGTVMALSVPAIDLTGLTTAVQLVARLKMVAAFVRDNPLYLVNPAFDPTINVPGFTAG